MIFFILFCAEIGRNLSISDPITLSRALSYLARYVEDHPSSNKNTQDKKHDRFNRESKGNILKKITCGKRVS